MIYITCTMAAWDFADIYTHSPRACGPRALGVYISKIPHSHGITITCTYGETATIPTDTHPNIRLNMQKCLMLHTVLLVVHINLYKQNIH